MINRARLLFASMCALTALVTAQPAAACEPNLYADNGRYVGGDLATQIAAKADTIQIVRVTGKHIVRRNYTQGGWYLQFGEIKLPDNLPEFTDEFVFELSVVETLKQKTSPRSVSFVYERSPRVMGYSQSQVSASSGQGSPNKALHPHPNQLPDWLPDRPGNDRRLFNGADPSAGLGLGECTSPYFLEVGQTLIAFRDSLGRLYPVSSGFPLKIDAEFLVTGGSKRRVTFNMQSLVPINDDKDAFLSRLRQALGGDVR